MLYYLQFRPDKKEAWHLVDESKMDKLPQKPSYVSVLAVDKDVEKVLEDEGIPLDEVKYRGPMYFDLDNEANIDAVLDSTRELLNKIRVLYNIPNEFIHCWLSGGKGVHITIPAQIFGVNRAVKHLPVIYKKIAETVMVPDLDMSVYSASRGRLWRCEHVARPGSGTFKVGVTVEELEGMDAELYQELVAQDRQPLPNEEPAKSLSFPKAEMAFKKARQEASQYVAKLKQAKVIPIEEIRKIEGIPGCIEKLIKQGDCDESNWNQAAMQVASWVAARYEKEEEDLARLEIIEPFLENVSSSSRNEHERRKHMSEQLGRAYRGRTKFMVGPLISTIGERCGACPLCRGDLDFSEGVPADDGEQFDPKTNVKALPYGYCIIANDKPRQVTSFTFQPEYDVSMLEPDEHTGELTESVRRHMVGTLTDDTGQKFHGVKVPEEAWGSKSALSKVVSGHGNSRIIGTDAEIARVGLAVLHMREARKGDIEMITHTRICGIHMDKTSGGQYIPTYIESDASVCAVGEPGDQKVQSSRFKFYGKSSACPQLLQTDYPYENDTELKDALQHLFRINRPENVARIVGWMAATFLKEHIYMVIPQFPLLGVWGNASAGKTMTMVLTLNLTGMDYQLRSQPLNVETTTAYPLNEFVTSSTTVPRFIEEVNETNVSRQMYQKILGLFKAAWNRSTASRGKLGKDGAESDERRVSSPICYVSEQRSQRASLRNRTVEVMLSAKDREADGRSEHFRKAYAGRDHMHRAAKAMLHRSLTLSVSEVGDMLYANDHLLDKNMDERPRFSMLVVLMGLDFLRDSLDSCGMDISEDIDMLKQSVMDYLAENHRSLENERRTTEVDQVLKAMNQMAAEPDDNSFGLKVERHYYRIGEKLFINLPLCHSRYRRWARSVGDIAVINQSDQMASLLEGETFFDRITEHKDAMGVDMHVINLRTLKDKGIMLGNFLETNDI